MGRKSNISYSTKLQIIEEVMEKKETLTTIADKYSLNRQTLNGWVRKYHTLGLKSFTPKEKNRSYSEDLKLEAVQFYLKNNVSLLEVCSRYGITSVSVLSSWIRKYESNINDSHPPSGAMRRKKTISLSRTEKWEIVNFCLSNNSNYLETAKKFGVSYNQVYNWVKKYKEAGISALEDNRGLRRKKIDLEKADLEKNSPNKYQDRKNRNRKIRGNKN